MALAFLFHSVRGKRKGAILELKTGEKGGTGGGRRCPAAL